MNAAADPQPRSPTAADHVALRALIKYMSRALGITYKKIAQEAKSNESAVKNYANDKSTMAGPAAELYTQLFGPCASLVAEKLKSAAPDPFLIGALTHLFGAAWVRARGVQAPASPDDEPPDRAFGRWAHVWPHGTEEVEARYCGLWRVIRASTRPTPAEQSAQLDLKEINCSLLNIRPRAVAGGTMCDFKWYYLGRGRQHDERLVFEGFVFPNVDRLEFFGRAANRHDLLSLMVWRFASNPDIKQHAEVSEGLSLSVNTSAGPVAARVRAFFVPGSETLADADFEALKDAEMPKIGVWPMRSSDGLIPPGRLAETAAYLNEYKPIVGFFANEARASDE
jgi:hypothetical protein